MFWINDYINIGDIVREVINRIQLAQTRV